MDVRRVHMAVRGKQMRILELENALVAEKEKSNNHSLQVTQEGQMTTKRPQGSQPSIQDVQPNSHRLQPVAQILNSMQVSDSRISMPQQQQWVPVSQRSSPHSSSKFGLQSSSSRSSNQGMQQFSSQPQSSTSLAPSSHTNANPLQFSHPQISQHSNVPSSSHSLQSAQTYPCLLLGQQHTSQYKTLPQHMDNATATLHYKGQMQRNAYLEKQFVATSQSLQPSHHVQASPVQQHSRVIPQNTKFPHQPHVSASQYHHRMQYSLTQAQRSQVSQPHFQQPSQNPLSTQQDSVFSHNEMQMVRQRLPVTHQPIRAPLYPQQVSQHSPQLPTQTQQSTEKNLMSADNNESHIVSDRLSVPNQNICSPHQPQPATSVLHRTLEGQQCSKNTVVSFLRDVIHMRSQRSLVPQQPVHVPLQPQQSMQHSFHGHIPTHQTIDNGGANSQSNKVQSVSRRLPFPHQSVPVSHQSQQAAHGPFHQPVSSPLQSQQTSRQLFQQPVQIESSQCNANQIVSQELPVPNQLVQVTSQSQQAVQEPIQEVPTTQEVTINNRVPLQSNTTVSRRQVTQQSVRALIHHHQPKPQSMQKFWHLLSRYQMNGNDPQRPYQPTPGHQNTNPAHVQSNHTSDHNVDGQQSLQSDRHLFAAIQELLDSPESYRIDNTSRKLLLHVNQQSSQVTCGQKETSKQPQDVQVLAEQQIESSLESRKSQHRNVDSLSRHDHESDAQCSSDQAPTFQKPICTSKNQEIRELDLTHQPDKNEASDTIMGNDGASSSRNKYDMLCKIVMSKEGPFEKIIKEEILPLWSKEDQLDHGDCQNDSAGNMEVKESMNVSEFLSSCVEDDVLSIRQNEIKEDNQRSAVPNYLHSVITPPQTPPTPLASKTIVHLSVDAPSAMCSLPQNTSEESKNQENIPRCTYMDKEHVTDVTIIPVSSEGGSQSSSRTEGMPVQTIEHTSTLLGSNTMKQSSVSRYARDSEIQVVSSSVESCPSRATKLSNSEEFTSNSSLTENNFQQSSNVENICDHTHVDEEDIADLTEDSEDGPQCLTSTEVIPVKTVDHSGYPLGSIATTESDNLETQVVTSTVEFCSSNMLSLNDTLSPCSMLSASGEKLHSPSHDEKEKRGTFGCKSKNNCNSNISELAERKSVENLSGSPGSLYSTNVGLVCESVEGLSASTEVDSVCARTSSVEQQKRCDTDVEIVEVVTKNSGCYSDLEIVEVVKKNSGCYSDLEILEVVTKNPLDEFFSLKTDHSEEMEVGDAEIEYSDDEKAFCVNDTEIMDEELNSNEEYGIGDEDISEKSVIERSNSTEDLLESYCFGMQSGKQNATTNAVDQDELASVSDKQENCVIGSASSCTSSYSNTLKHSTEDHPSLSDNHLIIHVVTDRDTGKICTKQKIPEECPMCYTQFFISNFRVIVPDFITGIKYICTGCQLNISMNFVTSIKYKSYSERPVPKSKKRKRS